MRAGWLSLILIPCTLALSACAAQARLPVSPSPQPALSLEERAAAEATALVGSARATALVLNAQREATAVMAQVSTLPPAAALPTPGAQEMPTPAAKGAAPQAQPTSSVNEEEYKVELLDVGFAADGGFIIVRFKATRAAVDDFWPGRLSLTDEATGTVYKEVPVMPVVGVLIGRPRIYGQIGYVMFVNTQPGLPRGSLVTVQLSKFTQEHVKVSD